MFGKNFGGFVVDYNSVSSSGEYANALLQGDFLNVNRFNPGTQKAKGVFFLQEKSNQIKNQYYCWSVPKHILFPAGTEFSDGSFNFPVFARPCPLNPRHGFVDSTVCKDAAELNRVSSLTLEADPDAELLVTKPVNSAYNIIINGGVITFAAGNDGATAGKGVNYFYISDDPLSSLLDLDKRKIIADDETPFYELVAEDTKSWHSPIHLVQVRSAPKTPRVKDFVPAQVTVKTILKAEGDLLDWEALLKTVDPKTTIVDHLGGSLSSHYAIHAIVNKVPIFTTFLPSVGETIQPTVENTEITEQDTLEFRKAFAAGFSASKSLKDTKYHDDNLSNYMSTVVKLGLSALHNFSAFSFSKDYSALGMVMGLFCRTAFAISTGETRYNRKRINTKYLGTEFAKYYDRLTSDGRTGCYSYMQDMPATKAQDEIYMVYHIFDRMKWDSSYGGKAWASCTKSCVDLFNAAVVGDIKKAVELLNVVINENHNGGKYLNKVIGQHEFDVAANTPSSYVLSNLHSIVDVLHHAWKFYASADVNKLMVELSPVDLTWKEEKAISVIKLSNLYIPAKDGDIKTIEWVAPSDPIQVIDLPNPVKNSSGSCNCKTCNPSGRIVLYSIPFWIVNESGDKIISKSALKKILSQMGFQNVEIK